MSDDAEPCRTGRDAPPRRARRPVRPRAKPGGREAQVPAWAVDGGKTLAAVDDVLRRATLRDITQRTQTARGLWAELGPLLARAEHTTPPRVTRAAPRSTLASAVRDPWSFKARFTPAAPLGLRAAAVDPDGHAIAASAEGLWYWEGAAWLRVQPPPGLCAAGIRRLVRLGPGRWLAAGAGGEVAVFTPHVCEARQRLGPLDLELTLASAASASSFAIAGQREGRALIHAFCDGAWSMPVALGGLRVTGLVAGPADELVVSACDASGSGHVWSWRPGGPMVKRAEHPARVLSLARGPDGVLVTGEHGYAMEAEIDGTAGLADHPGTDAALVRAAVDPAGTGWAAAPGEILRRAAGDGPRRWSVVWSDPVRTSPWVELVAFSGMVLALAEDGTVVVGHQSA